MTNSSLRDDFAKPPSFEHLEQADYLSLDQQQLYYVLHPTGLPLRARVLLAGPFASERPHRYITWVRWARYLASHGFEVMRFDYRGVGESTGRFEDFGFCTWSNDFAIVRTGFSNAPPQHHSSSMAWAWARFLVRAYSPRA